MMLNRNFFTLLVIFTISGHFIPNVNSVNPVPARRRRMTCVDQLAEVLCPIWFRCMFAPLHVLEEEDALPVHIPVKFGDAARDFLQQGTTTVKEEFDGLLLKDLVIAGRSGGPMREAAGRFFFDTFLNQMIGEKGEIYADVLDSRKHRVKVNCFSEFVSSIVIKTGKLDVFSKQIFDLLSKIEFIGGQISLTGIQQLYKAFERVRTLRFTECDFKGDLHDDFLQNATVVNRLAIRENRKKNKKPDDPFIGTSNRWLKHGYRLFEYLEIVSNRKNSDVFSFLGIHENITEFATNIEFLIANMDDISNHGVQLETLSILHENTQIDNGKFKTFLDNLSQLHQQKFFKHLRLYFKGNKKEYVYPPHLLKLVTLYHASNENPKRKISISSLTNLVHLYLHDTTQVLDLHNTVQQLTNLEGIYFTKEKMENILPFVHTLPDLTKIRIDTIIETPADGHVVSLNLPVLLEERNTCQTARKKLTIFVDEKVYVATKAKFNTYVYGLIEVKRNQSFDPALEFGF